MGQPQNNTLHSIDCLESTMYFMRKNGLTEYYSTNLQSDGELMRPVDHVGEGEAGSVGG